ncbi:hypothetical protein LCGC14_1960290 [marine sediment metagenome]|uniref:Uncharacterized protein n=1 Tax=marine sediment metagenome TaxID=412755 RepID=A0A0F9G358_9ZZZZ
MLYNVCFSDELFSGGNLQVEVEDTFESLEDFLYVLIILATSMARDRIVGTGFNGLLDHWDRKRWHIHDFELDFILNPPETIYICSSC